MIDWNQCPEVESVPGKLGGKWVFKNSRLPISVLFGNLADGATVKDVVEWYNIDEKQLVAVLEFLAQQTDQIRDHAEAAAS